MDMEVMKEIIFSCCQSEQCSPFSKGNEKKGVDKKLFVGVMTQKLGIS
jgi:hypothetical protein